MICFFKKLLFNWLFFYSKHIYFISCFIMFHLFLTLLIDHIIYLMFVDYGNYLFCLFVFLPNSVILFLDLFIIPGLCCMGTRFFFFLWQWP